MNPKTLGQTNQIRQDRRMICVVPQRQDNDWG
jgi:hypothetical protein